MATSTISNSSKKIINLFFLLVINVVIISILGYMPIDISVNTNSRIGGLLLSILVPLFIVFFTQNMDSLERVAKFGFGLVLYLIASAIITGIPQTFTSGLMPCLILSLASCHMEINYFLSHDRDSYSSLAKNEIQSLSDRY